MFLTRGIVSFNLKWKRHWMWEGRVWKGSDWQWDEKTQSPVTFSWLPTASTSSGIWCDGGLLRSDSIIIQLITTDSLRIFVFGRGSDFDIFTICIKVICHYQAVKLVLLSKRKIRFGSYFSKCKQWWFWNLYVWQLSPYLPINCFPVPPPHPLQPASAWVTRMVPIWGVFFTYHTLVRSLDTVLSRRMAPWRCLTLDSEWALESFRLGSNPSTATHLVQSWTGDQDYMGLCKTRRGFQI